MKWPKYAGQREQLDLGLGNHSNRVIDLPGISDPVSRNVLAMQLIASVRREKYYELIQRKEIGHRRADPKSNEFNAEHAVVYFKQQGDLDEAAWLIFLMAHFGKHKRSGWQRLRDVYGRLGQGRWSWQEVVRDHAAFEAWLRENWLQIGGGFGNHSKYKTIDPAKRGSIGPVVNDYIEWIGEDGHVAFFAEQNLRQSNDKFDVLFSSMKVVHSFGRLGKFDYLMLLARYDIVPLIPQSAYLVGATGPRRGVNLLFTGSTEDSLSVSVLQDRLTVLDESLELGMEILEDALCNWQKKPLEFKHFTG